MPTNVKGKGFILAKNVFFPILDIISNINFEDFLVKSISGFPPKEGKIINFNHQILAVYYYSVYIYIYTFQLLIFFLL